MVYIYKNFKIKLLQYIFLNILKQKRLLNMAEIKRRNHFIKVMESHVRAAEGAEAMSELSIQTLIEKLNETMEKFESAHLDVL